MNHFQNCLRMNLNLFLILEDYNFHSYLLEYIFMKKMNKNKWKIIYNINDTIE